MTPDPAALSPRELAQVLRAQGHEPAAEDVARVVRILRGDLTVAQVFAELDAEVG